ncbi:hypothetical protein [Marinilactibacillus sp. Marseille-P9653]|uniref:hypothetical protein n=1 Tax=Marinilactibacillus sp. Marseille-P9653 TaxID=2866583 RepID=UPI001CE3DC1C|nr:hypothetical protein [Marinilactibacillus sp. Marseille-P9653]
MDRKTERKLIIAASVWHFINAILTIFVFGLWFKNSGDLSITEIYPEMAGGSGSFVDILYTVMTSYGLIIILVGIINIYCLKFMKDNEINKKWQVWMVVMCLASFLTIDVISSLLYMIVLVTYSSKNKAIRLKHESKKTNLIVNQEAII